MTIAVADQNCRNCFFVGTRTQVPVNAAGVALNNATTYICRCLPPAPANDQSVAGGGWRSVNLTDWCGYWSETGAMASVAAGPAGQTGPQGPSGTPAVNGPQWHYGATDPTAGGGFPGNNGDWYVQTGASTKFWTLVAGTWTLVANVVNV